MWHTRYLPKHFTKAGAREYRYRKRSGEPGTKGAKNVEKSYTGQKRREMGHTIPLVYTGLSRMLARFRDVRATSQGVAVVIKMHQMRRRTAKLMRDELTRTTGKERMALAKYWVRSLNRSMDRDKTTTTERL